jgi:hypothetical protein
VLTDKARGRGQEGRVNEELGHPAPADPPRNGSVYPMALGGDIAAIVKVPSSLPRLNGSTFLDGSPISATTFLQHE